MDSPTKSQLKWVSKFFNNLPAISGESPSPYVLFPLTDYQPPVPPRLVSTLASLITKSVDFSQTQILVGSADRGSGPLVYAISALTHLPFALANWYPRQTYGQILVENASHWSGPGFICLNGIKPNQNVSIVTDLISTGGTVIALAQAVLKAGAKIKLIVSASENTDLQGSAKIAKLIKVAPISVVKYRIINGQTKVIFS